MYAEAEHWAPEEDLVVCSRWKCFTEVFLLCIINSVYVNALTAPLGNLNFSIMVLIVIGYRGHKIKLKLKPIYSKVLLIRTETSFGDCYSACYKFFFTVILIMFREPLHGIIG